MVATEAQVEPREAPVTEPCAEAADELAPARGMVLGAALGLLSLVALGALAWWVL